MSYQVDAKSRGFYCSTQSGEPLDVEYETTEKTFKFDNLDVAKAKARELGPDYHNVVVWDTETGEIMFDTLTGYEALTD